MGKDRMDDREFVETALRALPSVAVPVALETRLLAGFDALAAKRAARAGWLRRWRDIMWPGAPLWKPASVLALSLLIGLSAGTLMPTANQVSAPSEQTLAALDSAPVLDLSGDL
jgi:hypothetical protein